MKLLDVVIFVCLGDISVNFNKLLLDFCSRITPGELKGPYGILEIEHRSAAYKATPLPAVLSVLPHESCNFLQSTLHIFFH